MDKNNLKKLKILFLDIETAPLLSWCWNIWNNDLKLNQIEKDWVILAWSAKWLGDPENKIIYKDQRNKNIENDKQLLKDIWKLLDTCDIVVTQNGKKFDIRKLNARFIINGMKPPSSFRHIDLVQISKKHFSFTSHKLEYMSNKLCKKYKKLKLRKFQGFELWKACMKNNIEAWKEMERYNKIDVLALEELYYKIIPWDNSINIAINNIAINGNYICSCGHDKFFSKGLRYTNLGAYQRKICKKCGKEHRFQKNILTKDQKDKLKGD